MLPACHTSTSLSFTSCLCVLSTCRREKVGQTGEGLRGRVFKQAVVGVEHLLGEQEEPLPGHTAVVQALLRLKLDPQPCLQNVWPLKRHDAPVRLLEDVGPVKLHLKAVGNVSLGEKELKYLKEKHSFRSKVQK